MRLDTASNKGFTLIEVMVAVVVLAIGLLGMATLMMQSLQSSESAYSRSQATILAYDIIDRMRANKVLDPDKADQSFRVTHASISTDYNLANPAACPAPSAAGASPAAGKARAQFDLGQWCTQLQTSLPNVHSDTNITRSAAGSLYTVQLSWIEAYDDDRDGNPDIGTLIVEVDL